MSPDYVTHATGTCPAVWTKLDVDYSLHTRIRAGDPEAFRELFRDHARLVHRHAVRVKLAPATTDLLVHEGQYVPGQGVPLFELRPPVLSGVAWLSKRAFDLVVAGLIVVVGLPLWLLVAAAIKLDSRGSVFFVDRRIGVGEREFGMLKFRTMVADAAERQAELERENEASGALFKIRDDPRVTRVGRTLRRFSLDELPQLVNVLRGEMSLVGPRPLIREEHDHVVDWARRRQIGRASCRERV